ncbi:hypothetical protein SAMN02910369_02672 [Lachnospiraceae bacterium NE2001]|nr:hypothetical protein SAMN02910369_02672 [Lachnospiraceae bacterium NE2001]
MKSLYITNMRRLGKSILYILGLLIAFGVTFAFTNETVGLGKIIVNMPIMVRPLFISIAIIAFFTIYTPLVVCSEYSEGIFRNKMISGFSQKQIYFSGLLSQLSAATIMWMTNVVAGVVAGAGLSGTLMINSVVLLVGMLGYTTLVYSIAFRLRKPVRTIIISYLLLNMCLNTVLAGNFIIMITEGIYNKIASLCYNINVMGQWCINTGYADPEADPGRMVQLLLTAVVIAVSIALSTMKLEKRDIV